VAARLGGLFRRRGGAWCCPWPRWAWIWAALAPRCGWWPPTGCSASPCVWRCEIPVISRRRCHAPLAISSLPCFCNDGSRGAFPWLSSSPSLPADPTSSSRRLTPSTAGILPPARVGVLRLGLVSDFLLSVGCWNVGVSGLLRLRWGSGRKLSDGVAYGRR
jgi:hypothetical protein